MIRNTIHKTINDFKNIDTRKILDLIKVRVKENSIVYAKEKAQNQKKREVLIQNEISEIEQKLDDPKEKTTELKLRYTELKGELEKIYLNKLRGFQIRSRVKYYEEGERNTKYFLGLEKKNARNKQINKLMINGEIITKESEILKAEKSFYQELYTSSNVEVEGISRYLSGIKPKRILENNEAKQCDGPISEQECKMAIFKMKTKKVPGSDGIPVEFYHTFWDYIKHIVVPALNESLPNKKNSSGYGVHVDYPLKPRGT